VRKERFGPVSDLDGRLGTETLPVKAHRILSLQDRTLVDGSSAIGPVVKPSVVEAFPDRGDPSLLALGQVAIPLGPRVGRVLGLSAGAREG
jgi:hypothetical protein